MFSPVAPPGAGGDSFPGTWHKACLAVSGTVTGTVTSSPLQIFEFLESINAILPFNTCYADVDKYKRVQEHT